jgi:hypothetical protein
MSRLVIQHWVDVLPHGFAASAERAQEPWVAVATALPLPRRHPVAHQSVHLLKRLGKNPTRIIKLPRNDYSFSARQLKQDIEDRVRMMDEINEILAARAAPRCQPVFVTPTQPRMAWRPSQDNIELMPEKKVLDFKVSPRFEQVGDKCAKQMKDCKHRSA